MTKIIGSVSKNSQFANLVNEWFHQKIGRESPVDAALFKELATELNLNWIGLYAMAIIETGYFNSKIFHATKNMFGIGAVDSDPEKGAAVFFSFKESVKCGAQHLAVYAGSPLVKDKPENWFVIPRTFKIMQWGFFGIVSQFQDLGGKNTEGKVKWASNPKHGEQVEKLIEEIIAYCQAVQQPEPEPVTSEPLPPVQDKGAWKSILAMVLKVAWPILTKFFPWLGWATVAVYAIIEFLTK